MAFPSAFSWKSSRSRGAACASGARQRRSTRLHCSTLRCLRIDSQRSNPARVAQENRVGPVSGWHETAARSRWIAATAGRIATGGGTRVVVDAAGGGNRDVD